MKISLFRESFDKLDKYGKLYSMKKKCTKCGKNKLLSDFHKYKRSSDGVRTVCKSCRKKIYESKTENKVAFRRGGSEHLSNTERLYEAKTGMRICSTCKKSKPLTDEFFPIDKKRLCRQCKVCRGKVSKVTHKKAYAENPERFKEYARNYRNNNTEAALERYKRYHKKHAVKIAVYSKNRRKEHPEKVKQWWQDWYIKNSRIHNKKNNANRRDAGYVSSKIIKSIEQTNIKKYGILTCEYCKVPVGDKYHLEHKNPISRGGKTKKVNLCIACPQCNLSKGSLTAEEYRKKLKVVS